MRFPRAAAAGLLTLALAGCASGRATSPGSSPGEPRSGAGSTSPSVGLTGRLTVFAAASLREPFTEIARQFEAANPGVSVSLSFAGSSALAAQIVAGAPADVFASASAATMQTVVDADAASDPKVFATNTMGIAVPDGNPGGIASVADLARPGVSVALCQPQVPCGVAASQVIDKAAVSVRPVTLEPDVKAVLSKVTLGEVDAGIVYVTDLQGAGGAVVGVTIPADVNAVTDYQIVAVQRSTNAAAARAFVGFVVSREGREVLSAAGFGVP